MPESFLEREYGLSENPFVRKSDLTAPMANRASEEKRWTETITRLKGQPANSMNFIIGDYGMGKTLSLYKIFSDWEKNREVHSIFMKFLPEDSVSKFGLSFILRLFASSNLRALRGQLKPARLGNLVDFLPEPVIVFRKYLKGEDLALEFLEGANLPASDLRELGIKRKITDSAVAQDYLIVFLFLLKQSGMMTTVITVDEMEYAFSQLSGAKIAQAFNFLRALFDLHETAMTKNIPPRDIANMVFFFGISQAGWTQLRNLEKREQRQGGPIEAFFGRVDEEIQLPPLRRDDTKELIESRLKFNRKTKKFEKDPLIPYTEEFVEYVAELSLGNPREVVKRCNYVLLDGLEKKVPLLTKEFAEVVFKEHRLRTEV